ncbi:MAG: isoprenylcysteine carboxylmethyltransferase family protein [Vicinamibacterales bacterium]
MVALIVLVLAFVPMLLEARLSARHERALRTAGAFEPHDDVYPWMRIVYPAAFVTMAIEAARRSSGVNHVFVLGLFVFCLGKGVKYWAMSTLGPRWTFRVLVPPSSSPTRRGPYRFLRHPNYFGVIGELVGIALMARAPVTGSLSVVAFAMLLARRIRVEERALNNASSH